MANIAIIGAGISGLVCGHTLQSKQHQVTYFDKAGRVAGRTSTRLLEQRYFDHGAQYFTVKSPQTKPWIENWLEHKVCAKWQAKIVAIDKQTISAVDPAVTRYVGTPHMSSMAEFMAQNQSIQLRTKIENARLEQHWKLTDDQKTEYGPFDFLICTTPPAQAKSILNLSAGDPLFASVNQVKMNPCWATMIHFEQSLPCEFDAAFINDGPLSWIARNNSKPGRDQEQECWVLHASPNWTLDHLETSEQEVSQALIQALFKATNLPSQPVKRILSKRWLYSIADKPLEEGSLLDEESQLGICGDWCHGSRVEGALLSGLDLANKVNGLL